MRLKEIFIRRYGPISGLHLRLGVGLQPIYGLNESGKTLVLDALLKKLLGLGIGFDPSLDRVEEKPEGYIVLEHEGQEIKLKENETLATYLPIEPGDLKNLFVVRDADLRIAEEDVFYKRVTDRITGLRLGDIGKIEEQLRHRGKLTGGLQLSDREDSHKAKSQLKSAQTLRNDVEGYLKKAEADGLHKLEADIFQASIQKAQFKSRLELLEKAKKKGEFGRLNEELESAQSTMSEIDKIPGERFQSLRERLTLYEAGESKFPHFQRSKGFFKILSCLSLICILGAFIGLFLLDGFNVSNFLFQSIFFILPFVFVAMWLRASHKLSEIERDRASILKEAVTLGLKIKDVSGLRRSLEELDAKARKLRGDLNQKLGVLKKDLEIKLDSPDEIVKESSEKLAALEEETDLSVDITWDKNEYEEEKRKLDEVGQRLENLQKASEAHLKALEGFTTRALKLNFSAFLDKELDLEIENLDSLRQLMPKLDELESKIREDAKIATDAIRLFGALEEEEKAKVAVLFEKRNLASQLFNKTTQGRYSDVEYDYEQEKVIVRRPNDETFLAEQLSRGARDQLYLSIRVALGRTLLEGKNSFFIMDDAFISSDDNRIKQQIDLLKDLSDMGWQIIYFSAKRETIDLLTDATKNKTIRLKPFP